MQTRVSRHNYDEEILDVGGRTRKNADLYKKDYNTDKIVIPKISNGRELDEDEFEKIINQSKTRSMKTITPKEVENYTETKKEEKIYDINSVLEKAKQRRKETDSNHYKVPHFEEYVPIEEEQSEISEDIDLLSDLMGGDNTVVTPKLIDDTIIDDETDTSTKIDNSFYSKSLKFERKDFDDSGSNTKQKSKKHSKAQVIITVAIVVLLIVAVVLGILILGKIKF